MSKSLSTPPSDEPEITHGEIFFTLSNPRRRYVLNYLKQNTDQISTGDLAAQVAAWENGIPPEQVSNRQRKRAYTSIHQTHLPKMDEMNLLDYDERRGMVTPTERVKSLDFYLEVSPVDDLPWHKYYTLLAIIGVSLGVAVWAGVFPFSLVPPSAWFVSFSLLYLASAAFHYRNAERTRLGADELPPSLRRE